MNPSRRSPLSRPVLGLALALVASMALPACGPGLNRPLVDTPRRQATIRVEPGRRVRGRSPSVVAPPPASSPLPPSNGIDVPVLGPDRPDSPGGARGDRLE